MSLKDQLVAIDQATETRLRAAGKAGPTVTAEHVVACVVGKQVTQIPNTLAILVTLTLYNGWEVHGFAPGPVDRSNFDFTLGEEQAEADAYNQIWPLEAYLLRDRLHRASGGAATPTYGELSAALQTELAVARELLASKGYAYDAINQRWENGSEGLSLGTLATLSRAGCESGCDPETNPVTRYDADGVPLCEKCFAALEPATPAEVAEQTGVEQIDGAADIVSPEQLAADGSKPVEDFTTLNDAQRAEAGERIKAELDAPAPSGVFAVETGGEAPPVVVGQLDVVSVGTELAEAATQGDGLPPGVTAEDVAATAAETHIAADAQRAEPQG